MIAESRVVSKGDFVLVPPGLPHAFTKSDGKLVLMSPRLAPVPAAKP